MGRFDPALTVDWEPLDLTVRTGKKLVVKTIDIEPAYPGEDPRCERQEDGTLRCEVSP